MRATHALVLPLTFTLLTTLASAGAGAESAPTRSTGPVFEAWGPVFDVDPDYLPPAQAFRAVWDMWIGSDAPDQANGRLDALARFMNMHARQGIPVEDMHLAIVFHGTAGKNALSNEAYRERFGVDNPDLPLLRALAAKGVRMFMCGQSAASRGYGVEELIEPVQVAPSAYTALMGLQAEGYALMPTWH